MSDMLRLAIRRRLLLPGLQAALPCDAPALTLSLDTHTHIQRTQVLLGASFDDDWAANPVVAATWGLSAAAKAAWDEAFQVRQGVCACGWVAWGASVMRCFLGVQAGDVAAAR
jgi:hypothetical protein